MPPEPDDRQHDTEIIFNAAAILSRDKGEDHRTVIVENNDKNFADGKSPL